MVAESSGDDFIDDFRSRQCVFENVIVGAAKIEFALHEAFEPGEIGVHIGADVVGGNSRRQNRGQRLLEWNARFGRFPSTPAAPFVAGAEQVLMPANLLNEFMPP